MSKYKTIMRGHVISWILLMLVIMTTSVAIAAEKGNKKIKSILEYSESSDGKKALVKEEQFNNIGNPIETIDYSSTGSITSKINYFYNDKDQLIKKITLKDKYGKTDILQSDYKYGTNDKVTEEIQSYNGKALNKYVYTYRNGNLIQKIYGDIALIRYYKWIYLYNNTSIKVSEEKYSDEKLTKKTTFQHDENGDLQESTTLDSWDSSTIKKIYVNNFLRKETGYRTNGNLKYIFNYDEKGRFISSEVFDNEGVLIPYDRLTIKYESFDKENNWLYKEERTSDKIYGKIKQSMEKIHRVIQYYE